MVAKRLTDLISSTLGVIVLSPVFLLIIILILIFMPGPVFFRQARVGMGGKEFRLLKFRSMTVIHADRSGEFSAGDRSRITPLGKVLRKLKLDEIPQLINVIRGDMSLVGPRPEVRKWTEVYPEKWEIIHKVRPGMTDEASIRFRNEEEMLASSVDPEATYRTVILPEKLDIGIKYVNNRTYWGDIGIILRTFLTIIIK